MLKNFFKKIFSHKIISGIIILILAGAGYFGYKKLKNSETETRYMLVAVEKGTITTSISGTGQVAPVNQADLKPKVSGEITKINIENGQEVLNGEIIAQIDAQDAEQAIRDAKINLESAELALKKLKNPSGKPLKDNLTEENYASAYKTVSDVFTDLPTIVQGLDNILHNSSYIWGDDGKAVESYGNTAITYRKNAEQKYATARQKYEKNLLNYQNLTLNSDKKTLDSILDETYETIKTTTEAVKSAKILADYIVSKFKNDDLIASISTDQNSLENFTDQVNTHLQSLLTSQENLSNAQINLKLQEFAVEQKTTALRKAKEDLAKYTISAPFDGVITAVNIEPGDIISSSTILATLMSKQMLAQITLNEVDAGQAKIGQKSSLSFDAINDLRLTGEIIKMDSLGTVSQGVVTYSLEINFDTQDERIKPSMSVSAQIITNIKQDVLLVPNSAIKQQGEDSYVQIADGITTTPINATNNSGGILLSQDPRMQIIQTGLSNDTMTEVISGLKENERVITQIINSSSIDNQPARNTGFGLPGMSSGSNQNREVRQLMR